VRLVLNFFGIGRLRCSSGTRFCLMCFTDVRPIPRVRKATYAAQELMGRRVGRGDAAVPVGSCGLGVAGRVGRCGPRRIFGGACTLGVRRDGGCHQRSHRHGSTIDVKTRPKHPDDIITVGAAPYGVAVTSDGKTAFVTNNATGTVSTIDVKTRTKHPTDIAVGPNPLGVAVTPCRR
jgi:YVTN family beta-propeller protein